MKTSISISSNYGFDHNWTLNVETKKVQKSFYLGQDVKFCNRVLGMSPREIVLSIGTAKIDEGTKGNEKLAKFIVKQLDLTEKRIESIEAWELCSQ